MPLLNQEDLYCTTIEDILTSRKKFEEIDPKEIDKIRQNFLSEKRTGKSIMKNLFRKHCKQVVIYYRIACHVLSKYHFANKLNSEEKTFIAVKFAKFELMKKMKKTSSECTRLSRKYKNSFLFSEIKLRSVFAIQVNLYFLKKLEKLIDIFQLLNNFLTIKVFSETKLLGGAKNLRRNFVISQFKKRQSDFQYAASACKRFEQDYFNVLMIICMTKNVLIN